MLYKFDMNANSLPRSTQVVASPSLITRQELAARWHCSVRTLQRLERRGVIRSRRLPSGRICYLLADIAEAEATA